MCSTTMATLDIYGYFNMTFRACLLCFIHLCSMFHVRLLRVQYPDTQAIALGHALATPTM